jgi:hypothetical protein
MAQRSFDRVMSFGGGVDSFRPASELQPNQSQKMQNMIVRNNYACRTRYGADQIGAVSFAANVTPSGPVQALFYYSTPANPNIILMGQGAKLYTWNGSTWSAPLAYALANANAQPAIAQGVDKVLISDGVSHCRVWDGTNFTDCGNPNDQLNPPLLDKLCWIAGRMIGAGEDNPDTLYLSNLLSFGPGQWNKATQSFRVGNGDGDNIVALAALQHFNLAILKQNSVWLLNLPPASTGPNQIAGYLLEQQGDMVGSGIGCVGKNAWCQYQNDLLFMSEDGVQSLQRMQAAAGQYELISPLSEPIQDLIDRINWSVSFLIKAVKYRQLAIFFVPLDNSAYNNYALVWNGILRQWTGYWTGWNTACACTPKFNNTLQLVLGNHDGSVNLWKDAPASLNDDATYKDNGLPISWELDTRSLIFGNFDAQKRARMMLIRFNAGNAEVNLAANLDLADDDTWTEQVRPEGDILPVVLPFKLASVKPIEVYRSLTGLPYFNEMYFKISANSGWVEARNLTASAYLKPVKDPSA